MNGTLNIFYPCKIKDSLLVQSFNSVWNTYRKMQLTEINPKVRLIGEVWGNLDFKPNNCIRYFINKLRFNTQEARQLEYVGALDGVLDFSYQQILCDAVHKNKQS